jgi:hypothetical protein
MIVDAATPSPAKGPGIIEEFYAEAALDAGQFHLEGTLDGALPFW